MRNLSLTHPIRQLALVVAGFVAVIVLLEADGLASWADHLEVGLLRTVAVPVTGTLKKAIDPLGVPAIRDQALESLARIGWSDDAALMAKIAPKHDLPATAGCATAANVLPLADAKPGSGTAAAGAQTPLFADVPRSMDLAPLPPIEAGKQRVVALAGDSMMAVGLSAELMRQAAGDKNLRIIKLFRSGTGLARPEVFNWMDEYPAMLGAEKPDVVIVAIGANDGQGFVVNGKVLPYDSEGWRKVYQERTANYLAMVGAGGARVVWVGLPPMRVPVYNQKIATVNRIAYTVVSQSPRATWWNPAAYVGDESGRYREFVTRANGQTMRIRSSDGIHLSDEGAGLFIPMLLKWLDPPPPPTSNTAAAQVTAPAVQAQPVAKPKRRGRRAAKG